MRTILSKIIAILPAVVLQIFVYYIMFVLFKPFFPAFTLALSILGFLFVLYIITNRGENSYKMLWMILLLTVPILGAWLYLSFGNKNTADPILKKIKQGNKNINYDSDTCKSINDDIKKEDLLTYMTLDLISKKSDFPICYAKNTKFYAVGEDALLDMLKALKNAKETIYIEYFIISNGTLWKQISDILIEKVKEGIDVRIIYDDVGSIATFPLSSIKELINNGIKVLPFNPIYILKFTLNNRTHRKMMIIDNEVVFSGGINLSDEYININSPFGHWKDLVFKLDGDSVNSYTKMFIDFWNAYSKDKLTNKGLYSNKNNDNNSGYILSYYDSPGKGFELSNNYFIHVLNTSKKRVWFYTPYLILGDSLMDALIRAAQRGIDVKIITPGIPDKKIVFRMTRSYYKPLLDAGVKIYEYTPGFVHAKASLVDDDLCSIGTVNLDYRSLFLHFECNSIFYKTDMFNSLKEDFELSIKKSREVKEKDLKKKFLYLIGNAILRLIAPLF